MTKQTALITGAHGFLGKHLSLALAAQKIVPIPLSHNTFFEYDEILEGRLKKLKPDFIFHLASFGNMSEHDKDPDSIYSANLLGTYKLLKATTKLNYKAFINISTSSVMLDYETLYSATKKGAEALCRAFSLKYTEPIISVRPFSIYGVAEQETHLIPRIFRSCLYREPLKISPKPVHDYVFVDDVVRELINIATHSKDWPASEVQIGTGVQTSNAKLVRLIEQITGRKANIVGELESKPFDTDNWKADPKKGWVYFQATPLLEGLQKVYESYKL